MKYDELMDKIEVTDAMRARILRNVSAAAPKKTPVRRYALLAACLAVVLLGAGCGVLGSTVNPFAVGVAVDALSGVGIAVNQAIIIALGAILWLVTITISIIFVMRYAKKVKADKGSTFLSLQEQQDMMNEWGMKESEVEAELDRMAQNVARITTVDRPAQEGDTAVHQCFKYVIHVFLIFSNSQFLKFLIQKLFILRSVIICRIICKM